MLDRIILFPYYLYLKGRNAWYNKGGKRVKTAEVPTLCVGNVTAGGTGKTPHVEMIVSLLGEIPQWAGCHPAVLSRGYKRESKGFQQVLHPVARGHFQPLAHVLHSEQERAQSAKQ